LKTVAASATVRGTPDRFRSLRNRVRGRLYTYNGFEQLISRVITNSGTANGTTYFVHDLWGNVIAELTTAGATVREYIYLPEAEIAPTRQARTQVDRPVAVVDAVNTATPVTLMVHVDHLNRPVRMTNSAKASVWDVVYTPWGAFHSATGAQTLNTRFPGQWFQLESGLHYNWHRHYDPTLGRYTQPDPLGFVDGPSVYAYAGNSPFRFVDKDGRIAGVDDAFIIGMTIGVGIAIMCMSNSSSPPKKKTKVWSSKGPEYWDDDDCPNSGGRTQSSGGSSGCSCTDKYSNAVKRCSTVYSDDGWARGKCMEGAMDRYNKCMSKKGGGE
jgi:RHS repeat-associated protein